MRLGMFMMPVHPPGRTFWSTLEEDSEKSVLADALGFDELWLGEHFSATTEPIPSPMMFFAGLLPHTKNIAFGTAVINLPNHHPAIVAAEAAQFDHMSKGRFMLGVGPGGLVSDFELFNNPDVHARNRMVIEAVDFIQRIWSQDPPYDLQGEFWQVRLKDGDHSRARRRLYAETLSDAGTPDLHLAGEPELLLRAHRRAQGMGNDLRQYHPDLRGREPLGRVLQGLRRSRYPRQRRELASRAQCAGGALGFRGT